MPFRFKVLLITLSLPNFTIEVIGPAIVAGGVIQTFEWPQCNYCARSTIHWRCHSLKFRLYAEMMHRAVWQQACKFSFLPAPFERHKNKPKDKKTEANAAHAETCERR